MTISSEVHPSLQQPLESLPTLNISTSSEDSKYLTPYRKLLARSWIDRPFPRRAEVPNGLAFKPLIIDRSKNKLDHDYKDRAYIDVRYFDVAPWIAARKDETPVAEGEEKPKIPQPAIIHFHAGNLVAGSGDMFDEFLHKLALESGVKVFSVEYRLAPERSFPSAVLDCVLAIEYIMHVSGDLNIDPTSIGLLGSGGGGSDLAFLAAAHQIRRQPKTDLPAIRYIIASSSTGGLPTPNSEPFSVAGKGKSKQSDAPLVLNSADPDFHKEITKALFEPSELSLMMEGNEWGQWLSLSTIGNEVLKKLPTTLMIIPQVDGFKDGALNLLSVLQQNRVKTQALMAETAVHLSMELFPDAEISVLMREGLIKHLKENLI